MYFANGVDLQEGADATLRASAGRDRLHLTLDGNEGISKSVDTGANAPPHLAKPSRPKCSTSGSQIMRGSSPEAVGADNDDGHGEHFFLGEMDLARLNDQTFHESYATAVARVLATTQGMNASTACAMRPSQSTPHFAPLAGPLVSPLPNGKGSPPQITADNPVAAPLAVTTFTGEPSPFAAATSTNAAGSAGVPTAGALVSPPASPSYVLDLYGAWSLAGLLVAQLELEGGGPATKVLALCGDGEVEIAAAMNALARANGLESDRYVALAVGLIEFASWVAEEVDSEGDPSNPGDTAASPVTTRTGRDVSNDSSSAGSLVSDVKASALGSCCGRGPRNCRCWPRRRRCGRTKQNRASAPEDRGSSEHDGREWSVVLASSVVEGSGLLRQGVLGDLELCRRFICAGDSDSAIGDDCGENRNGDGSGGRGAAFLPGSLEVVCQGLQRASLLAENRVLSTPSSASSEQRECGRCCGVDVTPVNAFGVANFRELDLSRAADAAASATLDGIPVDFTADISILAGKTNDHASLQNTQNSAETCGISDAVDHDCDKRERMQPEEEEEVFLTKPAVTYKLNLSDVRAGVDGCTPRRSAHLPVARRGTLHAIAYWYRQRLVEPHSDGVEGSKSSSVGASVVDTGPVHTEVRHAGDEGDHTLHCSREGFSHFRQAALLLDEPVAVDAGQVVDLSVFCTTSQGVVIQVLGIRDGG